MLLCGLLCCAFVSKAQTVVVSRDVDTTGKISNFGPNRLFYFSTLGQLGAKPGPQVYGAQTNWWSSSIAYGVRGKLKLCYWNSLVMDVDYRYDRFSMRQKTPKLPPLISTVHQRERISLHNISFAFCDRINFKRRGNVLGNWLDLGVYADQVFRSANVFLDQHFDSNSPNGYRFKSKTTITRLPYIEKFNYGVTVRLGFGEAGFFAQWRINSLFKYDSENNRDLPKLTVGVEYTVL